MGNEVWTYSWRRQATPTSTSPAKIKPMPLATTGVTVRPVKANGGSVGVAIKVGALVAVGPAVDAGVAPDGADAVGVAVGHAVDVGVAPDDGVDAGVAVGHAVGVAVAPTDGVTVGVGVVSVGAAAYLMMPGAKMSSPVVVFAITLTGVGSSLKPSSGTNLTLPSFKIVQTPCPETTNFVTYSFVFELMIRTELSMIVIVSPNIFSGVITAIVPGSMTKIFLSVGMITIAVPVSVTDSPPEVIAVTDAVLTTLPASKSL